MSLRRSLRFIVLLVAVTVLAPLSMQMFLPALPAIQSGFRTDAGTAQLTLTLAMVAVGVANLAFGPLSDRYGRKPVLLAGIAFFLAGSLVAVFAENVVVLIVGRVVQAAGASAGIVLARAMARDVYGFAQSVRVISYLTMVMVIAPTVAPAVGGFVVDAFGWRAIFWIMIVAGAAAALAVASGLPETHTGGAPAGWGDLLEGCRRLITARRYIGYTMITSAAFCVFFSFLAAAPYLTAEVLHLPASAYGLWFMPVAGIFILGTFCSTRFLDRYGADRLIRAGAIASALAMAASLPLYYLLPISAPLLFGPMIAISFIQGFIIPNAQASAINVDPRFAGAGSGLIGFITMLTSAAAAQAVAVFADGTVKPMLAFMALGAAAGVVFLPLIRKVPAPAVETGAA